MALAPKKRLARRSSFDPWQPSECGLAHQTTTKREIRMLRLVQKSLTTTQILQLSFREGVWFAVSILPFTPGRGIFIPRAARFRRDCERGFTARTRSVLYAVNPSDANSRRSRTSFVPGVGLLQVRVDLC